MCAPARAGWIVLGLLALLPGKATAQTHNSPPRLSIAGGAGVAVPFHGDFDFIPWAWEADVRQAVAPDAVRSGRW